VTTGILKLFVATSALIAIIGGGVVAVLNGRVLVFLLVWAVTTANLLVLGIFYKSLTDFLTKKAEANPITVAVTGSLKLTALAGLTILLWKTVHTDTVAVLVGLTTYVIVPVVIGLGQANAR
jgi:hypothetical protein